MREVKPEFATNAREFPGFTRKTRLEGEGKCFLSLFFDLIWTKRYSIRLSQRF